MPLYRSRKHKMIAGVCGGFAEWLGWDPTVVRIAYVDPVHRLGGVPRDDRLRHPLDGDAQGAGAGLGIRARGSSPPGRAIVPLDAATRRREDPMTVSPATQPPDRHRLGPRLVAGGDGRRGRGAPGAQGGLDRGLRARAAGDPRGAQPPLPRRGRALGRPGIEAEGLDPEHPALGRGGPGRALLHPAQPAAAPRVAARHRDPRPPAHPRRRAHPARTARSWRGSSPSTSTTGSSTPASPPTSGWSRASPRRTSPRPRPSPTTRAVPPGRVALVLGAGNVSSIGPMDALYKLFVEDQVVVFKTHPVNVYLGPLLEEAFRALIDARLLAAWSTAAPRRGPTSAAIPAWTRSTSPAPTAPTRRSSSARATRGGGARTRDEPLLTKRCHRRARQRQPGDRRPRPAGRRRTSTTRPRTWRRC